MDHYGASSVWVVSNRDYTEQAYTLAKSNGVRLVNREQLIEMILAVNPNRVNDSKVPIKEDAIRQPASIKPSTNDIEEPDLSVQNVSIC